jgi:hypothetical protein
MKIKNISTAMIVLAGVKIQAGGTISISALGSDFVYSDYQDEIESYISNGTIEFIDNNTGKVITDINIIRGELESLNGDSIVAIPSDETIILNPDFYYNYKDFELKFGESIQIQFIGYLKSVNTFSKSGNIEMQIVEPLMNKVQINESDKYEIDSDYKLFNPIVKITAITNSIIELYMDGIFEHPTKTKNQYLKEIYSDTRFPSADLEEKGNIEFKCNFKRLVKNNIFKDIIGNIPGKIYNGKTLENFNKFEDGAFVKFNEGCRLRTGKDFTINIWFKSFDTLDQKQFLVYKQYFFEMFIVKSKLNVKILWKNVELPDIIEENTYYMFTVTYDSFSSTLFYYINDTLVGKVNYTPSFYTFNRPIFFGGTGGHQCLRSAELGEFNYFSHHFSAGMVDNLYLNNNPEHQFQTFSDKCYSSEYTCDTSLEMTDTYNANIIKKEYARQENLVLSSKGTLNNTTSTAGNLIVMSGYVYFPKDSKYTFEATYDESNKLIFTIDGKDVLINEKNRTYYIEEGYYVFNCTSFGPFHISYAEKGAEFIEIPVFNDDNLIPMLDLDNETGGTFTGVSDMIYTDSNYTEVQDFNDEFFSNTFSITLDFKRTDDEAEIIGQGPLYDEYLCLLLQNKKIVLIYRNTYIETPQIDKNFNNIQITANGSKVFLYLNGKLIQSAKFEDFSKNNTPLYFGRSGEGKSRDWLVGDFELKNVKFLDTYSSPAQIQGRI